MWQDAVEIRQQSVTLLLYSRWIYRLRFAPRGFTTAQYRRDVRTYYTLITKYFSQYESLETPNFTFKILLILIKQISRYCDF